ncbi:hypothetical protein MNBD_GAMMA22-2924 [hydrothermal vent metagenome]|uniref:Uncharacterized protein n=1 Tax=hydrothermal vent metagenome TaxID=652676 RepID=A0A3B1AIR1_9ZZZZ
MKTINLRLILLFCFPFVTVIQGCAPDIESESPIERIQAVEQATFNNQTILQKIALEDTHYLVRRAAVEKLNDQTTLIKVALVDEDAHVRYSAAKKITSQIDLQRIAQHDKSKKVRLFAVSKLTNQTVLIQIAVKDMSSSVRLAATQRLNMPLKINQAALVRIALEEKDEYVLIAIIKRLTDAATLVQLFNDNINRIQKAVANRIAKDDIKIILPLRGTPNINHAEIIEKIIDQKQLFKIALSDQVYSKYVMFTAISKINSRAMLAKIAKRSKIRDHRNYANARLTVEAITSQAKLIKIAKKGKNEHLRKAAIIKLTNQSALADIALNDNNNGYLKATAISRLKDNDILKKIVYSQDSIRNSMSYYAAEQITDQTMLINIVNSDLSEKVRRRALARINDQNILIGAAKFNQNKELRATATKKIHDQKALEVIAKTTSLSSNTRAISKNAIQKIINPAVLKKIVTKRADWLTKIVAKVRLVELAKQQGMQALTAVLVKATDISDTAIRKIALLDLMHENLLTTLAYFEKTQSIRKMAIRLLDNQEVLQDLAANNPSADIREVATIGISSDAFLLQQANTDTSSAVRLAAVRTFHNKETILKARKQSYYFDARSAAYQYLIDIGDRKLINQAKAVSKKYNQFIDKLLSSNDSSLLIKESLQGKIDVYRKVAASKLNKPADISLVANSSNDRKVLMLLLEKIEQTSELKKIANTAVNPAIRLAAAQKSGLKSWDSIFESATNRSKSSRQALGDALAAVALFKEIQPGIKNSVQQAALELIRIGNESRIPEMVDLLTLYGNTVLAEDYLNCGQPDLNNAALAWAKKNGYNIRKGGGSHRARWGSK